jgi:hypothetical protein
MIFQKITKINKKKDKTTVTIAKPLFIVVKPSSKPV